LKVLDSALARSGHLLGPVRHAVANSGLRVTVGTVLLAAGLVAIVTFAVIDIVTGSLAFGGGGRSCRIVAVL
jgi:hypothetical protein